MLKTYEVTLEVKLYVNANDADEAEENAFKNTFGDEVRVIDVIEEQSDYPNEDADRERYFEKKYANS